MGHAEDLKLTPLWSHIILHKYSSGGEPLELPVIQPAAAHVTGSPPLKYSFL